MTKKIIYTCLSIFLAYLTIKLIGNISNLPHHNLGWLVSSVFAALLCLYVTGVFAFVGFEFPTHKALPKSYYEVSNPKFILSVHKYMGLKYFNIFLMVFFWGKPKNRESFFDGTRYGIDNLLYQTKQSEFGHFGAFMILLGLTIWIGSLGHYKMLAIISIINIIGNLYPILLQRKHRVRIDRMSRIMEKRAKDSLKE